MVVEYLVVVAERLVVTIERSYSLTTLFSILTTRVVSGSKRRANKVVGVPTKEKAIVEVVVEVVSLL